MHRHEAADWQSYKMNFREPHRRLEPEADEIAAVGDALQALVDAGILPHAGYDQDRFLAFRNAVRERFEIPWTAITPRQQRLIYAINAIAQPVNLVAVGVFCGFTFSANAGAAVGPGAAYVARRVIGIELNPSDAALARQNVAGLDPDGRAEILASDGVKWLQENTEPIDLLYLDATAPGEEGKSLYHRLLLAAQPQLSPGALVLAHNSQNAADKLAGYLATVRDRRGFLASVNVVLDDQGLEVSRRLTADRG